MSLKNLNDEYICISECYFDNRYHRRGEHWLVPAGTEFDHDCFQLISKAEKAIEKDLEPDLGKEDSKKPTKKKA